MDDQQRATREAFERALGADRYDAAAHKIFSDFLSDVGADDEAEFHRAWTAEWQWAYDAAELWLREFAESVDLTYEQVIDAGHGFLRDGEWLDTGPNMKPENYFYSTTHGGQGVPENDFWANWRLVTQCPTPFDPDDPERIPFKCSC